MKDWDTMIAVGGYHPLLGDAICLVAAETPEILAQAKALVKVDYEDRCPWSAVPGRPCARRSLVHRTGNLLTTSIQRGNPAEAIAKSKHVLTRRFTTPYTEHAFLEPECAVAYPDGDGVMILSTDQGAYDTQHETMGMLGLPAEKVKVRCNCLVGGGFGGKEDVTVQHHAALIAYLTKRPVKVKLTRAESILIHPKRHPMEMEFSIGCDENGIIQGVAAEVIADTGAFASLGGPVLGTRVHTRSRPL